jgi:hypothetical protein
LNGKSRKAQLIWAHWKVRADEKNEDVRQLQKLLTDITEKASDSTAVLVALQVDHQEAENITNLRKVRLNPKTTIAWTEEDEHNRLKLVEQARLGAVFWVGSKLRRMEA